MRPSSLSFLHRPRDLADFLDPTFLVTLNSYDETSIHDLSTNILAPLAIIAYLVGGREDTYMGYIVLCSEITGQNGPAGKMQ